MSTDKKNLHVKIKHDHDNPLRDLYMHGRPNSVSSKAAEMSLVHAILNTLTSMLCRVIPASSAYLELWEKRLEYAHNHNSTTAHTRMHMLMQTREILWETHAF